MSAKETAPGKLAPGTARKGALKRLDGEPLTRQDLQYDFLAYVFNDTHAVFTDPFSNPPGKQVTFRDLYVSAILHAPKTARSVRDKIVESDAFATDFAMLSLLANVGRVNTSMAFFPETRTALRTYHPVPALQRSDGNLTDAPRIRNALKSVVLSCESKHVPNSPFAILAQRETGPIPTTSVVNLLFVLTQHSTNIGVSHFTGEAGLEFTDLFQPVPIPSTERGRAFLWLLYHYLESTENPNPFVDTSSPDSSGAPRMHRVEPNALVSENIDTEEEKEYGERMSEHRRQFLATDKERQEAVIAVREERDASGTPAPSGVSVAAAATGAAGGVGTGKPIKPKGKPGRKALDNQGTRAAADGYTKFRYDAQESNHLSRKPSLQLQPDGILPLGPTTLSNASYKHDQHHRDHAHHRGHHHNQQESISVPVQENVGRGRKQRRGMRTEPYEFVHSPERTMFQQAWHRISTRDVLYDSDEPGDEHVRLDLTRRLQTLSRLRGKSPTPELEPAPVIQLEPERESMHGIEMEHYVPQPVMDIDDRW